MLAKLLFLAVVLGVLGGSDPCAVHPDCQQCVNDQPHVCGWCSTPVVYKDGGIQGNHCGTLDGTHPWACYGIFSTTDCIRGYICNSQKGICEPTNPGEGTRKEDCLKNCTAPIPSPSPSQKPAAVYKCNTSNYTCFEVPPGQGASLPVCLAGCHKGPTPSPVSPNPSPAQVYKCIETNYTCVPTAPGTGASKEVCMQQCHKPVSPSPGIKYACNFSDYQCAATDSADGTSLEQCKALCVQQYFCDQSSVDNPVCKIAPYPTPGVPLPECQQNCKPHNITPSDLIGTWRGLQIGEGYQAGEWDVNFKDSSATFSFNGHSFAGSVSYSGLPRITLTVTITHSSLAEFPVSAKLQMIFDFDGAAPEVRYLSLASGKPNAVAPKDWAEAKTANFFDWTLWECQPLTGCKFTPNTLLPKRNVGRFQVDDPCSDLLSCTECLAKQHCGWCTQNVIYKDGTPGKHCAGLSPNGSRNQFQCPGSFHTDDCNDYLCVEPEGKCVKVPLGGGQSHDECTSTCKPGPSPSHGPIPSPSPSPSPKPAPVYKCDTSNYTCVPAPAGQGASWEVCLQGCHKGPSPSPVSPNPSPASTYLCDQGNFTCIHAVPGTGTSREICLQLCRRPPSPPSPPGPPIPVTGTLRGLQIDNAYHQGEFQLIVAQDGAFTLSHNTTKVQTGRLSLSNKVGYITASIETGVGAGTTLQGYFTQSKGRDVTHTLIVFGKSADDIPTSWDAPWIKGGANGAEWVWTQLNA